MKNMKYLFLLSITSAHVVSASHEFMLNCAHSLAASKALQAVITRSTSQASTTQQAPAGPASTVLSWLNPFNYITTADQSNPAIVQLKAMQEAIQKYYDNAKLFGKSTGNNVQQAQAKQELAALITSYNQKLDEKDAVFKKYESDFINLLKETQENFSNLLPETTNDPLFKSIPDLLAKLNPFGPKLNKNTETTVRPVGPTSEDQDLLQQMREALVKAGTFDQQIAAKQNEMENALLDSDQPLYDQLKETKANLLAEKANTFVPLFKQYVEKFGSFNEKSNPLGIVHTSITSKDKTQPIMNDAELREILQQAQDKFKNDNLKVSLGLKGYKASLEDLLDDVKSAKDLADDNN